MEPAISARCLSIRLGAACLALLLLPGCFSTQLGVQYLPERTHFEMFEKLHGARVRHVRHVEETLWGQHWLGFELKRPNVREVVDEALEGNPNYYVSNLDIHTDMHGTIALTATLLILYLPRVTVVFDVVEILPAPDAPS